MLLLFLTVIFLSAGYVGQKLSRACVVFVVLICRLSIKHISQNWLLQGTHTHTDTTYLILLHLQSCDSYNLHDLYAIFYTVISLILSVKQTPYECAMKNYSIQDMLYTPGPGCSTCS
jgi:hypothetical protein